MAGVMDRVQAKGARGFDVFEAVVEEENLVGCDAERGDGVAIDSFVGLGETEAMGEDAHGEGRHPGEPGHDAFLHDITHVGENAGEQGVALQGGCPVDHGLVGHGPEIEIGGDESGESLGSEAAVEIIGDGLPVGASGEMAEIVVEAMTPVGVVKRGVVRVEDGVHAAPGVWVGRAGEDEAVVEEDCAKERHPS